ncbi:MAG: hypothetical protein ACRD1Q_15920 [Vicinamibacterales bacterium]
MEKSATPAVRNPQAPVLSLNLTKRCGDGAVQARTLEPPQQKPLEHVKALVRGAGARFL